MAPPFGVIVFLVIAATALIWTIISIYNGLVVVRNTVQKSWENIDVVLQQRNDELVKLIDVTRAHMTYEQDMLIRLTELRTGYTTAKELEEKIRIENQMSKLLEKVKMVWEQYPDLKASQSFLQVQGRVSAIESKIADYREAFNDAVNTFNIQIERFPDLLLAQILKYARHGFLVVPEEKKQDVRMDFGAAGKQAIADL
jgi:LemA protein